MEAVCYPTNEEFLAKLVELIRESFATEPARYATVDRFSALGDVCDENEFLAEAVESFGLEVDCGDARQMDMVTRATDKLEDGITFARLVRKGVWKK